MISTKSSSHPLRRTMVPILRTISSTIPLALDQARAATCFITADIITSSGHLEYVAATTRRILVSSFIYKG